MMNRRAFLASSVAAIAAHGATSRNGWIYVQLSGSPSEIGFQHGMQLAKHIVAGKAAIQRIIQHDTKKDWTFYRQAAERVLWPRVEDEYRQELNGIAEGLRQRGVKWDLWDVVALNGWMELAWYYSPWLDKQQDKKSLASATAPEHCSAFVATGSYTKSGKPVIAHNAWVDFAIGTHWNIIFDVKPKNGHSFLMDGYPGLIHSGDDFGINRDGIAITETTISGFVGFDPKGISEFVRARKALQYSSSIDDFARIMKDENNGGYANNWLVVDNQLNEIASLELGLKNVNLRRTNDGYFAGANFPVNEKLVKEETEFDINDSGNSSNARRERWKQLMEENKGKIDIELAKKFLADGYDVIEKKIAPCERTLCGRIDLSPRGSKPWQQEYGPAGAVQNKAADHVMIREMRMLAAIGPQAGPAFKANSHIAAHPEFDYQSGVLKDISAQPWTEFRAGR